jgi:hypothetical protein
MTIMDRNICTAEHKTQIVSKIQCQWSRGKGDVSVAAKILTTG